MRLVFRTMFFHMLCIVLFAIIYYLFREHYIMNYHTELTFLDSALLSTTIQSSVGITNVIPITNIGKIIIIIQQILLILLYVFILYFFTWR